MTATQRRCLSALFVALALACPAFAQDGGGPPAGDRATSEGGDAEDAPAPVPARTPAPTTTAPTPTPTPAPSPAPTPEPAPPPVAAPPPAEPPAAGERPPARQPKPKPAAEEPEDEGAETVGDEAQGGEPDAESAEPEPEAPPPGHAATYHEQPSPLVFRVPARGRAPELRAKAATQALTEALDESASHAENGEEAEVPAPEVLIEGDRAVVRIGANVIATLYPEDARAEGMTFERYAPHMRSRLEAFVDAQLQRKTFQLFFLHLFLSVLFGVIGFLTLRGLRSTFDRWDAEMDDRRGSFKPISILRIPVFSGEALASALAFGLAVGRVSAYVATVIATVVAVLSQFEFTRPLLRRVVSWSAGPVLDAVEAIVTAVPGLILAALLIVAVRAGLRVLNILLDGVQSRRLTWQRLPPERVPVFRFSATAGAVILVAPLLVAAAFGRWGTPLETLALAGGVAVIVAAVPIMASYIIGVVTLWRAVVRPGDWVQVGQVSGEVTRLGFAELHLVPESGGTISIPMLYLLFQPLRRLKQSPEVSFEITVARDRPAKELIAALKAAVVAVESDAKVELVDICHAWIKARVSAPAVREGVRQQIMVAVSDAVDRQEFALPTLHGPDR